MSHRKYAHVQHKNCESDLAIIYKYAAHRLVQHTLQVCGDSMDRWSHLFCHVLPVAPIAIGKRDLIPVTETMSQATMTDGIDRLSCGYLYRSSHWIGKSMSGLHPCCRHQRGKLFMVHVFTSYMYLSPFWINTRCKICEARAGSGLW